MPRATRSRPFVIGLTGGIGMGKSETAKIFAAEGVEVHDADAAIAGLYAKGGAAIEAIGRTFPGTIKGGAVDRNALSALIMKDPMALERLEKLVHPLVEAERKQFLANTKAPIILFDIPLLFETGLNAQMDAVVTVSAPETIRHARVLARPGMTEEKFERLRKRQWDDARKRQQAHYVVMTDKGLDDAREQVRMILSDIRNKIAGGGCGNESRKDA